MFVNRVMSRGDNVNLKLNRSASLAELSSLNGNVNLKLNNSVIFGHVKSLSDDHNLMGHLVQRQSHSHSQSCNS